LCVPENQQNVKVENFVQTLGNGYLLNPASSSQGLEIGDCFSENSS